MLVANTSGLARVLEHVAPSIRASIASGSFIPSSYATPLAVASYAPHDQLTLVVTATSTEADVLRDALGALLNDDDCVAVWPGWDTHPLERVSPDSSVMATRSLLRWRLQSNDRPRILVASARSVAQLLPPEELVAPLHVQRGISLERDSFIASLSLIGDVKRS